MLFHKIFASTLLVAVFFSGNVEAYDLPKIKLEKNVKVAPLGILKSDWDSANLFEEQLKILTAQNKNLPPSSPLRMSYDKNHIFIAFYRDNAYFLDKYSIEVKKNSADVQTWTQRIFPVGQNVSPKNARATDQKFCYDGKNFFNALNKNNSIDAIVDDEDQKFMRECFKVGYYFAFGIELDEEEEQRTEK